MGFVHFIFGDFLVGFDAPIINHVLCICAINSVFVCVPEAAQHFIRQERDADMFCADICDTELYLYWVSLNVQGQ